MCDKTERFIKNAREIHGGKYDYSLSEYVNSKTKIKIICKEHGIFEQNSDKHVYRKRGCPNCAKTKKVSLDDFITKSNKTHNNKYDYSKVKFENLHDDIVVICKKCNDEIICKGYSHMNGYGKCMKCESFANYLIKCNKIHNNKYDYSLIDYNGCYDKVDIICPSHGIFKQALHSHVQGNGCPKCKSRKGEKKLENI